MEGQGFLVSARGRGIDGSAVKSRSKSLSPWLLAALWVAAIFAIIPLARAIQAWVSAHFGRMAFLYAVFFCLGGGVLLALSFLRRRSGATRAQYLWIATLAALYAGGAWHLRADPEEAMHFVEYGALSFLLFHAFRQTRQDAGVYVASLFLGSLLGAMDEVVQWAVPGRFFDFRDMAINGSAVLLMQLALAFGVRPAGIQARWSRDTLLLAWRFAAGLALLFMALLSATPARLNAVATQTGWTWMDEPLVEYGYRIEDPAIGVFFSRLSAATLRKEDANRAAVAGSILAARADDRDYEKFLKDFSPLTDPFLHELRVHLFRRDRYWKMARAHRDEPAQRRDYITTAFREQRILELFFGSTLRAAGLDWPPDLRARAEGDSHAGPYVSPVSQRLITSFQPSSAVAVLLILLVASRWALRYAPRDEGTQP